MIVQIMSQTETPVTTPEAPPTEPKTPIAPPLPEVEPDAPAAPPEYEPAVEPVPSTHPDKDDDNFETCALPDQFSGVMFSGNYRTLSA